MGTDVQRLAHRTVRTQYTFYVHGDDYEVLWIDRNVNGESETATDLFSNNMFVTYGASGHHRTGAGRISAPRGFGA